MVHGIEQVSVSERQFGYIQRQDHPVLSEHSSLGAGVDWSIEVTLDLARSYI